MRFIYYIVILAIFVWSQLYWGMPTFRWGFNGLPMMLLFLAGVVFVLERNWHSKRSGNVTKALKIPSILLTLAAIFALIIPFITSWSAFRADDYRNLIGTVKIGESFADDVAPISMDKIRIVDQDLAYRLGDKVLGAEPSLGSQAHLGEFRIQKVNGEFVWVAPLIHSGIFKWWNNKEGANGYVVVSATNERDVTISTENWGNSNQNKIPTRRFCGRFLAKTHLF